MFHFGRASITIDELIDRYELINPSATTSGGVRAAGSASFCVHRLVDAHTLVGCVSVGL